MAEAEEGVEEEGERKQLYLWKSDLILSMLSGSTVRALLLCLLACLLACGREIWGVSVIRPGGSEAQLPQGGVR